MRHDEQRWTGVASELVAFLTDWLADRRPLVQLGIFAAGGRYFEAALTGAGLQGEAHSAQPPQFCLACYAIAERVLRDQQPPITGRGPVVAELRELRRCLTYLHQGATPETEVVQRLLGFCQRLLQRGETARYEEYVRGGNDEDDY